MLIVRRQIVQLLLLMYTYSHRNTTIIEQFYKRYLFLSRIKPGIPEY